MFSKQKNPRTRATEVNNLIPPKTPSNPPSGTAFQLGSTSPPPNQSTREKFLEEILQTIDAFANAPMKGALLTMLAAAIQFKSEIPIEDWKPVFIHVKTGVIARPSSSDPDELTLASEISRLEYKYADATDDVSEAYIDCLHPDPTKVIDMHVLKGACHLREVFDSQTSATSSHGGVA